MVILIYLCSFNATVQGTFHNSLTNINIKSISKKHSPYVQDSNRGQQVGRHKQIRWAMVAPDWKLSSLYSEAVIFHKQIGISVWPDGLIIFHWTFATM